MTQDSKPFVLVVDDQENICHFCRRFLGDEFIFRNVRCWDEAQEVLAGDEQVAVVLLDRNFSRLDPSLLVGPVEEIRNEGIHILRRLKEQWPSLPVIMVTSHRESRSALEAARLEADYLAWEDVTADVEILASRLRRLIRRGGGLDAEVLARLRQFGVIGDSPALLSALETLVRALGTGAPILLLGPSGVGKDLLAYAAHGLSGDPSRPFVNVNVAAIPSSLMESELFGARRGAFTSADRDLVGKIRMSHGGTLFLNEIAELAPEAQSKLLTVIESGEVHPLGGGAVKVDFRLVAATSADIRSLVNEGQFLPALYYRLAVHVVEVPPLAERREDIPILIGHFLQQTRESSGRQVSGITREAMDRLMQLPWDGNVRELKAVVEAAAAEAEYMITPRDVETVLRTRRLDASSFEAASPGVRAEEAVFEGVTFEELKARFFHYLYARAGGRIPEVARLAGISKATAYEWLKRYGTPPSADSR
jgi:two-component system response regulator HydG